MSALLLVRHGQASFGSADYDRLSPLGEEQVTLLQAHFARTGQPIDAIYSGALRRQRSTAEIIERSAGCGITTLPAFNEYAADPLLKRHTALTGAPLAALADAGGDARGDAGAAAGGAAAPRNFRRQLEALGAAWVNGELEHPQLESWKAFAGRVAEGLEAVMAREGRSRQIVISTSAGVIGAALAHVLGLDGHGALRLSWMALNSSVTRIRYAGNRRSLESFNAVAHLEREDQPRRLLTYL